MGHLTLTTRPRRFTRVRLVFDVAVISPAARCRNTYLTHFSRFSRSINRIHTEWQPLQQLLRGCDALTVSALKRGRFPSRRPHCGCWISGITGIYPGQAVAREGLDREPFPLCLVNQALDRHRSGVGSHDSNFFVSQLLNLLILLLTASNKRVWEQATPIRRRRSAVRRRKRELGLTRFQISPQFTRAISFLRSLVAESFTIIRMTRANLPRTGTTMTNSCAILPSITGRPSPTAASRR